MTSDLSDGPTHQNDAMSATKAPEHIEGYIDMELLIDIHTSLRQSEKSDDIALAAWIKQNYLQEPLNEISRLIRDSEGYTKLDKAYRRVRQLTGKAKDKWPFFDKNWKKLSATVVKNAILGDAAIGTTQHLNDGQLRDTPMSNGLRGRTMQIPQLLDSGVNGHDSLRAQEQKSPQPADKSSDLLETLEQKAHRQGPVPTSDSEPDGFSMTAAQNGDVGALSYEGTANDAIPPMDALRDAGAGKVRGPHGRYVNKSKDPSPATKNGPRIKQGKKSRTRVALEGDSEEEEPPSDEEIRPAEVSTEVGDTLLDGEGNAVPGADETPEKSRSESVSANDFQFPISAILAAEAEAVPSSLDRLPPGLAHKKRKSESSNERGGLKRARGSRGGVLGRPRKSEMLTEQLPPAVEKSPESEQIQARPETLFETTPKTAARRSSRKSAASALESSTPWDPTADVLLNGGRHKQVADHSTEVSTEYSVAAVNGGHEITGTSTDIHLDPKDTPKAIMNGASSTRPKKTALSQKSKAQTDSKPVKQKKRVSFSPELLVDDVQFFARITTSSGPRDIPLSEEDLRSEVDLVKRYAAWQKAGNTDASFEVFKNIAHFTR